MILPLYIYISYIFFKTIFFLPLFWVLIAFNISLLFRFIGFILLVDVVTRLALVFLTGSVLTSCSTFLTSCFALLASFTAFLASFIFLLASSAFFLASWRLSLSLSFFYLSFLSKDCIDFIFNWHYPIISSLTWINTLLRSSTYSIFGWVANSTIGY